MFAEGDPPFRDLVVANDGFHTLRPRLLDTLNGVARFRDSVTDGGLDALLEHSR